MKLEVALVVVGVWIGWMWIGVMPMHKPDFTFLLYLLFEKSLFSAIWNDALVKFNNCLDIWKFLYGFAIPKRRSNFFFIPVFCNQLVNVISALVDKDDQCFFWCNSFFKRGSCANSSFCND